MTITSIKQLLTENDNRLTGLIKTAQQAQHLDQVFHNIIDLEVAGQCKVAKLVDNILTVIVTNAAWATRLRYAIPEMIKLLQTQPEFKDLQDIRYTVSRSLNETTK